MASLPVVPADAPDWIKGWAKENTEFVHESNASTFSQASPAPRNPVFHHAPPFPPAAETASGIAPDTDAIGKLDGAGGNCFNMDRQEFSATDETIRRLGLGPHRGLHVRFKLEMGPYIKSVMKLQFVIRHSLRNYLIAQMIVPFQELLDKVLIVDVDSSEQPSLLPLLYHEQMEQVSELASSTTVTDPFPSFISDGHPALDIAQEIPKIRTLRVDIASKDIIISKSQLFRLERDTYPQALRDIADAVMESLDLTSATSVRLWFYPDTSFHEACWHALEHIDMYADPYADMLVRIRQRPVRRGRLARKRQNGYIRLSYNNFEIEGVEPPESPVPPTDTFIDGEQQTVTILGGAIEEIMLANTLAEDLWERTLKAVVIKDPYSLWEPENNDLQLYGIHADHQPLRWYFIVDLSNGVADMFPKPDVPFQAYLDVDYDRRPIPIIRWSPEQVEHFRGEIMRGLRLAEDKGRMAERACQQRLDKAIGDGKEELEQRFREKLRTACKKAYIAHASAVLFGMISTPSPQIVEDLPTQPRDVHLYATAQTLAIELRQRDDESDIDWYTRICGWVRDTGIGRYRLQMIGETEAFRIIRRQSLPDTPADVALCEVITARQSNWPLELKKPPVKLKLPHVTVKDPLNEFMANIWRPIADEPASTQHPTVSFKARYKPNDISIQTECNAITKLNSLKEVPSKRFWDWTQHFGDHQDLHNWLVQYPALGRQVSENQFTGERHAVLSRLDKVPFGYAAIAGGPESGKSSLAEDIVLAVVSEPCLDAVVTVVPPRTEEPAGPQTIHFFHSPAPQLPLGWETEPVEQCEDEPVAHNPKVAWVASENQLCDDAQVRLSAKAPGVLTLRARTWKCEMDNMFTPSDKQPDLISIDSEACATHQDKLLAEHINHQIQAHFDKASASCSPTTISEYAKRVAQTNPDEWTDYLHAYQQKLHDPEMFNLNHVRNNQFARDLLSHVLTDKVDIICCTPVALGQIVSHTDLQVDFVVIDEANRMTEAMSAVIMSKCPCASFLLVGDAEQSSPVATTLNRKDWKSFFGPQRSTSLFKRMDNSGALLYRRLKSK